MPRSMQDRGTDAGPFPPRTARDREQKLRRPPGGPYADSALTEAW